MRDSLKSQVSVEYMMIMGFATLITIPLLIIYHTYSSGSKDAITTSQASQIARKIVDASESVYFIGEPSQTILRVNFPSSIVSINLSNREVVFKISTKNGIAEIVEVSQVPLNGSLPTSQGTHTITLKAYQGVVLVSST